MDRLTLLEDIGRILTLLTIFLASLLLGVVMHACNSGKVAPTATVDMQAIVGLVNRVTTLETTIGEMNQSKAGRDINDLSGRILAWSVGGSVIVTALGLVMYILMDRWPTTRAVKDALKGKTNGVKQ